tara:strand:- start:852 stop:1430 length:579 start_codon:yes stop_codon:yes gene_type:complete
MSSVLYYSNYCEKCRNLIQTVSKSNVKNDMHFICVDKRVKAADGNTFVILQNGQKVILPPTITKVPSLLLLNKNHHVLFGQQITDYLQPDFTMNTKPTIQQFSEPMAFSLGGGMNNVMSDNYSFLDSSPDDLNAQGQGGTRQMHNYVSHDANQTIDTPTDDWTPDKISNDLTMEQIMEEREKSIPKLPRSDI